MASLTAPNPYNPYTAFGIGMPSYQPPPQTPVQTGLDLSTFGAPDGNPAASAAGRSLLLAPPVTGTTTTTTSKPTVPAYAPALAAAAGGLQAGQVGAQAYDTKSGIAATLGAGAAGAIAGAPAGPVGIAVGAAAGLAIGGLTAWMAVGKENKANRDRKRILAETKAEQKKRDEIARADALDELSYQRKQVEEAKRLEEWNRNKALIAQARAQKKARSEEFISKGYVV